ncbi:MAG: Crp/Fnr family transcriptional regulator, partial [Bacteroidia bacterium]|nr:Crp/Fnr family transcriptional regulator [Bacteroidia bacterium]
EQFEKLTASQWSYIEAHCKQATLKRGTYFLKEGQVNRRLGFIVEGVCRYACTDAAGNDVTQYFVKENQFLSAIESFNTQTPSDISIQAVTDTELVYIGYDDYQLLLAEVPMMEKLARQIVAFTFTEKMRNIAPMLQQDARARYEQFMRQQPEVLQRVPLRYVASYLGITQQSLSRLRKGVAVK